MRLGSFLFWQLFTWSAVVWSQGSGGSLFRFYQLPGPCGETSCASWLLPYLFGAVPQSYLTGHVRGLSPQFCPQNKTQFSTFRLCIVFFSQWSLTPHRNGRQISVSVSHVVLSTTLCAHTDCLLDHQRTSHLSSLRKFGS